MSTKIYAKARFGLREDTLENWVTNNPVLEKGEPAVISDSEDSRWLKIGDGKTDFNSLPWKFAGGAVVDKEYDPTSENAQSGIAVAEALSLLTPKEKNYESETIPFDINNAVIINATMITNILICFDNLSILIVNGDFVSFVLLVVCAIFPNSVFKAVATTIAFARPVTTLVPENNMFF